MPSLAAKIKLILTIRCEKASQLASETFERKLAFHERAAVRGHVLVCWSCRQFAKQLKFLRETFDATKPGGQEIPVTGNSCDVKPTSDQKQRLKRIALDQED